TADRWSMSTKPTHSPGHRSKRQSKNQPRPPGAGAVVIVTMSRATAGSGLRLRPGLLDPVGRGGRLVVAVAGLGPMGRRRDVADGDRDDPIRVPDRERIFRNVLAEAGDRVLVALV